MSPRWPTRRSWRAYAVTPRARNLLVVSFLANSRSRRSRRSSCLVVRNNIKSVSEKPLTQDRGKALSLHAGRGEAKLALAGSGGGSIGFEISKQNRITSDFAKSLVIRFCLSTSILPRD